MSAFDPKQPYSTRLIAAPPNVRLWHKAETEPFDPYQESEWPVALGDVFLRGKALNTAINTGHLLRATPPYSVQA